MKPLAQVQPPRSDRVRRIFWWLAALALVAGMVFGIAACDTTRSVRPANRPPVAHSLVAFPTTIGPGDSALVRCDATDPDGDSLVFDWESDCRLIMKGAPNWPYYYNAHDPWLVVYPGSCVKAPLDTGLVFCSVRDGKGGGTYAGHVLIVVKQ